MWQFDCGVFWAVLVALLIASSVAKVAAVVFPWNVTLSPSDSKAILGALDRIESLLDKEGN